MKTKILFWSLFNRWLPNQKRYERRGITHPALTPRWINHRFAIWKRTAYHSIMNQDWDCSYAVGCRAQSAPITAPLFGSVENVAALHSNIEAKVWLENVLAGYDQTIVVRLDSDDMYAPSVAREVFNAAEKGAWFYWQSGYGLVLKGMRLYEYNTKGVGPFFAHKYSCEELIERGTMTESHHHLIHNRRPIRLHSGRFIVTVHGGNLSTRVNAKRFIREIGGVKRANILKRFGLI